MLNIILTDHAERDHLLPLTLTRPVGKIRIGLWTIEEKWAHYANANVSFLTQDYLKKVFPAEYSSSNVYVNGAVLPSEQLIQQITDMDEGQTLMSKGYWIATKSSEELDQFVVDGAEILADVVDRAWKIFQWNGRAIKDDMKVIRSMRSSQPVPEWVTLIGNDIFIEEEAELMPSIINTLEGPVYIGKGAHVMEGTMIRGSLALMDHAHLKMGAKIYGPTTIGPHSKVGGEVNNSVIFGYSNKAHDGFIGNTVVGEWCNLGADTNTSNLKNNYADVKIFNYALGRSESTGSQFCGLTMGDHAKAGINTMFNTGTVCGIFANVFGGDFPHRNIPDFAWGGAAGFKNYRLSDALEVARLVMERRNIELTDDLIEVYTYLHKNFSISK